MLGERSLISLSQYLALQDSGRIPLFLKKCGIVDTPCQPGHSAMFGCLRACSPEQIRRVLEEICHSARMLRLAVSPKYLYEERWKDLERCLLLDGYRIGGRYDSGFEIVRVDPTIGDAKPLEDDLSSELERSNLTNRQEIIRLMQQSSDDFRKEPADFNGSLTSARVSLETITKDIASQLCASHEFKGDRTKFGANVAFLRHPVGFIDENEEKGIVGIYAFVSPGAHIPVGFTEEERVRLGRSMIAAVCYFLVKKNNANA